MHTRSNTHTCHIQVCVYDEYFHIVAEEMTLLLISWQLSVQDIYYAPILCLKKTLCQQAIREQLQLLQVIPAESQLVQHGMNKRIGSRRNGNTHCCTTTATFLLIVPKQRKRVHDA